MSDVFAADRIIWVEGPTEELCFPLLYEKSAGKPMPRGSIFTSVLATGDFLSKKRDRKLVYDIYSRLSSAATPLVVSVKFSFDSEELSDTDQAEMARESRGHLQFLPRRHLECYVIDAPAIAAFIAARDPQSAGAITVDMVTNKLREEAATARFAIVEWSGDLESDAWQAKVDAAKLISTVCASLSEQRATFNKKDDTLTLLKHVLATRPEHLTALTTYVHQLVDDVGAATSA